MDCTTTLTSAEKKTMTKKWQKEESPVTKIDLKIFSKHM